MLRPGRASRGVPGDLENLIEFAPLLGSGVLVTVGVAVLSLVLATALGALGAAAKLSRMILAASLGWGM